MLKRKSAFRFLMGFTAVLLVVGLVGIAVLRSAAFHRYALNKVVEKASQLTGMRVEIGSFDFHWAGLKFDFNRIVMHGTESASAAPLLQVDHLRVGLKIISLLRRQVDLAELEIDRPKINLFVDAQGRSNLGTMANGGAGKSTEARGGTDIFALAVGHFAVNQGELTYNDRHSPLSAELRDLNAQIDYSLLKSEYAGTLSYRDGSFRFGDFRPVQHGIQAQFIATREQLKFSSLKLNAGSTTLSLQGALKNYSQPDVEASYQGDISTAELGAVLRVAPFPSGTVHVLGSGRYLYRPDIPLVENLTLGGTFSSKTMAMAVVGTRTDINALRGDFHLSEGTIEARNVEAALLGGKASAHLTIAHLAKQADAHVAGVVQNISLAAISGAINFSQLKHAAISGKLDGTLTASWQGAGKNFILKSDAEIAAAAPAEHGSRATSEIPLPTTAAAVAIPVQGSVHLTYDGRSGAMTLTNTQFATSHTSLRLNGTAGKQSSLAIQAQSDDLREVDQLVLVARNATASPSSSAVIAPLGIAGSGSFQGQLRGSTNDLHLMGQAASNDFNYQGTRLSSLRASVAISPSIIDLSQGDLRTAEGASVQFTLGSGLKNWSYTPSSPVRVELTASRVPAELVQHLARLHYPVSGTLNAHISMHGSQGDLAGQGSVTMTNGVVWKQPVQSLNAQFHGAGSSITSTLQVQTEAGAGSGKVTYDFRNQGYDAEFSAPSLQIEKLEALNESKVHLSGTLSASLQGRGTVKDPQLTARIQSSKLVVDQQTLNGLNLQANMAQHKATFNLDSNAQGASIQARANLDLEGDYNTTASLDLRNVQLGTLISAYLPQAPTGLQGHTEAHATMRGPLKRKDQIEAEVTIPTLNLAYQSLQIGNASPIHAAYRGGVVTLDPCVLKGTGTDLHLQGSVPFSRTRNIQAKASGNVDVHLVQLLYPDWATSGQVNLDLTANGTIAEPNLQGTVHVVNAAFQPSSTPLGIQKLNAALTVKNGRIDIQNFAGEAGGGTVTAQGFATIKPAVQFNVRMVAKEVRLRYPVGTRAILDGRLNLTGTPDSSLLSGRVTIDRLSLTKEFNISSFADQFVGKAAATGSGFAENMKLSVSVNSANNMAVASNKLSIQGSANLMVRGTAADPVILGRTDITEGELFFNGQRYKVESGVVQFINPVETEPVVNLHVLTTVNQFDISMNFAGPIDRMRVTYTSDPPLAPVDIINLIATGKTTEAAAANSTTPQSVIAGQLTSQFSNRVEKLAGISSLTIDPNVGSGQGNAGARLTVQQRVTKNLFFSISTDLQNSADQTVQIEYQATRRFAVSTTRDQNGGYTIQIKMHHRF